MTEQEKQVFRKGYLQGIEATLPIKIKINKTITTDVNNTDLYATKNGTYTPAEGYTGFGRVVVDVEGGEGGGGEGGGGDEPQPLEANTQILQYTELIHGNIITPMLCKTQVTLYCSIITPKLCTMQEVQ